MRACLALRRARCGELRRVLPRPPTPPRRTRRRRVLCATTPRPPPARRRRVRRAASAGVAGLVGPAALAAFLGAAAAVIATEPASGNPVDPLTSRVKRPRRRASAVSISTLAACSVAAILRAGTRRSPRHPARRLPRRSPRPARRVALGSLPGARPACPRARHPAPLATRDSAAESGRPTRDRAGRID